MRQFNTTGVCVPEKHYMVNLSSRVTQIKEMVDEGKYFTINRARQYGKTTTLRALAKYLQNDYNVLRLDFQGISSAAFETEDTFIRALTRIIMDIGEFGILPIPQNIFEDLKAIGNAMVGEVTLDNLFRIFMRWCRDSSKPLVLMIDEVDSASNNQVFLDFLAQLRLRYLERDMVPIFQSVILAGVTDIKNLRRKLRPEEAHKFNSPWNIAADFNIDMSFSPNDIAGMLNEYEADHETGMDVKAIAQEIYNFTNGYPVLVSRICQLIDTVLSKKAWTVARVDEAVAMMMDDKSLLFESLMNKVKENAELSALLQKILFAGDEIAYNRYITAIDDAEMYGFIKKDGKKVAIFNRIFEMLLYDFYLLSQSMDAIFQKGINEKSSFVVDGHLQMEHLLERFIVTFDDLYGEHGAKKRKNLKGQESEDAGGIKETFDEEEGRRRFLLFVRAVINGTGNYYIEARTRSQSRIDVVIDYLGEQFVIELKIWRGNAYNERGEEQLVAYLDDFHLKKGYMLSYNFNKVKTKGIRHIKIGDRELVEAIV